MTYDEVIKQYGPNITKVATALGITTPTLYNWRKWGRIPYTSQLQIEAISKGKLKAEKVIKP